MYRLLAIAKYEERYVIPTAYAADGHRLEETATDCSSTSTADRACTSPVRSARPAAGRSGRGRDLPGAAGASNHRGMSANADHPSRVNLLNWDGRGVADGHVPGGAAR